MTALMKLAKSTPLSVYNAPPLLTVRLSHLDLLREFDESLLQLWPQVIGDVSARAGGTLLSLVFEGSTDGVVKEVVYQRRLVGKVEVFTTGLADHSRVTAVEVADGMSGGKKMAGKKWRER